MNLKVRPTKGEVFFINNYTMFHILEGSGGVEVDFKVHHNTGDKLIFLDKGQYIKFLTDDFILRRIEFEDEAVFRSKNVRVLFKHLVSLGYINFSECIDCHNYINDTLISSHQSILDVSSKHWYWQNPFNANKDEYQLIFDAKEIIDNQFRNILSTKALVKLIQDSGSNVHALMTNKIGLSIGNLVAKKRLLESKKDVAFSSNSIKEIAYSLGFKDPAYFSRVFKQRTGITPLEFRGQVAYNGEDVFITELYELIENFHASQKRVDFYANEMNLSKKTFSKKVKEKLQISIGQLIRNKLIETSKASLSDGLPIHDIAFKLGFEEPNHFSSFFKHYSGTTPTKFITNKKYKT